MWLTLPGKDGAVMDLDLIKLGGCAGKDGTGFALVVAMAVLVVEGDVAYAGPAVLNDGVGVEFGHCDCVSWLSNTKIVKNHLRRMVL